ncbi:putative ceramidase [Helianthus debilis subsp. tardiflorus]
MADGISSFWGPVTSSHEWCEKNYVVSSYVAEFYNTISTIPCILLADGGIYIEKNKLKERSIMDVVGLNLRKSVVAPLSRNYRLQPLYKHGLYLKVISQLISNVCTVALSAEKEILAVKSKHLVSESISQVSSGSPRWPVASSSSLLIICDPNLLSLVGLLHFLHVRVYFTRSPF